MKCKRCGREYQVIDYDSKKVNDDINYCPFCKYKIPKRMPVNDKSSGAFSIIFILIMLFIAFVYFFSKYQ